MVRGGTKKADKKNKKASNTNTNDDSGNRQLTGAAVGAGVAGLMVGGPVVALLAAGGAAYATTSKGKGGEVARASGEVVASAGDRLKTIDKKHRVSEKSTNNIVKGLNWTSDKLKPKPEGSTRK